VILRLYALAFCLTSLILNKEVGSIDQGSKEGSPERHLQGMSTIRQKSKRAKLAALISPFVRYRQSRIVIGAAGGQEPRGTV
jgi:hypothetical protein